MLTVKTTINPGKKEIDYLYWPDRTASILRVSILPSVVSDRSRKNQLTLDGVFGVVTYKLEKI